MATAEGGGETVLEPSASPCSNQQKGLDSNLDDHGYSSVPSRQCAFQWSNGLSPGSED